MGAAFTWPLCSPQANQKVRAEVLNSEAASVSTSVRVAGLGHPEFLLELTPVAVIPEDRFIAP